MTEKYFPPKCGYTIQDGCVRTDGSHMGKISGTMMGGILNVSPWSSPFQVACDLLGVAKPDLHEKPAIILGHQLELPIIKYSDERFTALGKFKDAESCGFKPREGDHDDWEPDFQDPYFTGHCDGLVFNREDGSERILEIKTTNGWSKFQDGVPVWYYWQVALYDKFITGAGNAYLVAGCVSDEHYGHPDKWVPSDDTVRIYPMEFDPEDVEAKLQYARDWYDTFIKNGVTPPYDPANPKDVALYQHLQNIASSIDKMKALADEISKTEAYLKAFERQEASRYEFVKKKKAEYKDYMINNQLSELVSESGDFKATLVDKKGPIDEELLRQAGIDPDKFRKVSQTFSIKKNTLTNSKE